MREASLTLKDLEKAIEAGKVGAVVGLPLNKATMALRLSKTALKRLEVDRKEVRIRVEDENVVMTLWSERRKIDEAYKYTYAYAQALAGGQSEEFLKEVEAPPLAREIIGEEPIRPLPDEDLRIFIMKLYALWLSSSCDEALHPRNLF